MLNEELLDDKDKKIYTLSRTIKKFKEYDEQRKQFIQKLQDELEDISCRYVEIKHNVPGKDWKAYVKIRKKYVNLKKEYDKQSDTIHQYKSLLNLDQEAIDALPDITKTIDSLTKRIKELEKENVCLKAQLATLKLLLKKHEVKHEVKNQDKTQ